MDFDIRDYVPNGSDPKFQELYNAINGLVNVAGHLTVRELFTAPRKEYSPEIQDVINKAGAAGIFGRSGNNRCWDVREKKCVHIDSLNYYCSKAVGSEGPTLTSMDCPT